MSSLRPIDFSVVRESEAHWIQANCACFSLIGQTLGPETSITLSHTDAWAQITGYCSSVLIYTTVFRDLSTLRKWNDNRKYFQWTYVNFKINSGGNDMVLYTVITLRPMRSCYKEVCHTTDYLPLLNRPSLFYVIHGVRKESTQDVQYLD